MGKHRWNGKYSESREHMLNAMYNARGIAIGEAGDYVEDYADYRDYHVEASQAARKYNV